MLAAGENFLKNGGYFEFFPGFFMNERGNGW